MIQLYMEHTGKQVEALKEAVLGEDAKSIEELAHSSKGGSLSCGMSAMAGALGQMEIIGREAQLQEGQQLMERVLENFDATRTYLKEHLTTEEREGVAF